MENLNDAIVDKVKKEFSEEFDTYAVGLFVKCLERGHYVPPLIIKTILMTTMSSLLKSDRIIIKSNDSNIETLSPANEKKTS